MFIALLSVRIVEAREDFGVRWQPAGAKRSEDWSAAATPLFDCGQGFQSGVAPALRDSRRGPKRFGCSFAALCPLRLLQMRLPLRHPARRIEKASRHGGAGTSAANRPRHHHQPRLEYSLIRMRILDCGGKAQRRHRFSTVDRASKAAWLPLCGIPAAVQKDFVAIPPPSALASSRLPLACQRSCVKIPTVPG